MNNDAIVKQLDRVMNEFETRFQALLQERADILDEYREQLERRQAAAISLRLRS